MIRTHNNNSAVADQNCGGAVIPQAGDFRRYIERRTLLQLGIEPSVGTAEAAAFLGLHPKTVERKARRGEIPAHPVTGVRRKTYRFYISELDEWLRTQVISTCHSCSQDKETIN